MNFGTGSRIAAPGKVSRVTTIRKHTEDARPQLIPPFQPGLQSGSLLEKMLEFGLFLKEIPGIAGRSPALVLETYERRYTVSNSMHHQITPHRICRKPTQTYLTLGQIF